MSDKKLKSTGFNRLKSAAVAGAVGAVMGGGVAFAASSAFTVTRTRTRTKGSSIIKFKDIKNFATSKIFSIYEASILAKNVSGMQQIYTDSKAAKVPFSYRWHSKLPTSYAVGTFTNTSVTNSDTGLVAPSFSRSGFLTMTSVYHSKPSNLTVATSFPNSCGVATSKIQTHYTGGFSKLRSKSPAVANCYYATHQRSGMAFKHVNKLNTSFTQRYDDAFDGVLWMKIDGNNFANPDALVAYDVATKSATTAVQTGIVSGIDAQVEFHFPTGTGIVRALYTLSNTTGSDINASVEIGGNLGSDVYTTVETSQSGDAVADDTDKWQISRDKRGGDPFITITRYGDGARVMPSQGSILGESDRSYRRLKDDYSNVYDVTVPANDSVSILVFVELNAFLADANSNASTFESLSEADAAGLLDGLTTEQRQAIQNYNWDSDGDGVYDTEDAFPNDATETVDTDGDGVGDNADAFPNDASKSTSSSGSGALDASSLLLLLGAGIRSFVIRRRKRT